MKLIGLTGSVATGKSTVANMFGSLGCYIIDADKIVHEVYEKNSHVYYAVVEKFGKEVLDKYGNIDRKKLREVVIKKKGKLLLLESIVHPEVEKVRNKIINDIRKRDRNAVVIYDVPLLFEKNLQGMFDCVIVVYVPESTQIKRLMERDKVTDEQAKRLISIQMSVEDKKGLADIVIDNTGSKMETFRQVKAIFESIIKGERC